MIASHTTLSIARDRDIVPTMKSANTSLRYSGFWIMLGPKRCFIAPQPFWYLCVDNIESCRTSDAVRVSPYCLSMSKSAPNVVSGRPFQMSYNGAIFTRFSCAK